MKMGSATKTRAARAASPQDVIPMANHETAVSKPASTFLVLQKSVRGVVTAFVASARPLGLAGVVVGLVWLALKIVDRFQLWMTAAGVLMVVMSVASAFQEVAKTGHQTAVQYDADEDDVEQCKLITIPTTDKQIAVTMHATAAAVTEVPVLATEKKKTHHKAAATAAAEKPARRNSSTIELGELTVVHCGTVIEIQGSRGFIIPHSLDNTAKPTKTPSTPKTRSFGRAAANKQATLTAAKLPLLIAFEISSVLAVLRHQIAVGQTVEFSFSGDESSPETVLAVNVTPVAAEQEIAKSRNALLTCKQAREESFARAMGELKMISPRNEPIKHHVDLIKYAEFLDDDDADLPLEQFI